MSPVPIFQGSPSKVDGCPWCFNRNAGLPMPVQGFNYEPLMLTKGLLLTSSSSSWRGFLRVTTTKVSKQYLLAAHFRNGSVELLGSLWMSCAMVSPDAWSLC